MYVQNEPILRVLIHTQGVCETRDNNGRSLFPLLCPAEHGLDRQPRFSGGVFVRLGPKRLNKRYRSITKRYIILITALPTFCLEEICDRLSTQRADDQDDDAQGGGGEGV